MASRIGLDVDDGRLSSGEPSDEALAARVAHRDVAAFSLLYDRYARPAYVLAAHLLGSSEAEETVQEAFLRLWHKAGQFDPARGSFAGWFMAVVRHQAFADLRGRPRQFRLTRADDIERLLAVVPDPGMSVEELAWRRERGEAVLRALQELPPEQRRALVLAYFGDLSQSAIAQTLGWPLGTVKKRVRLGMQKLRTALAPEQPESPGNSWARPGQGQGQNGCSNAPEWCEQVDATDEL